MKTAFLLLVGTSGNICWFMELPHPREIPLLFSNYLKSQPALLGEEYIWTLHALLIHEEHRQWKKKVQTGGAYGWFLMSLGIPVTTSNSWWMTTDFFFVATPREPTAWSCPAVTPASPRSPAQLRCSAPRWGAGRGSRDLPGAASSPHTPRAVLSLAPFKSRTGCPSVIASQRC